MNINKIVRNLIILLLLTTNIGCDQISKCIVRQKLDYNDRTSVIDDFITLTKVENTGAFLSFGDHLPRFLYIILMIIMPLIVLGYALYYLFTHYSLSKLLVVGLCLIIGGGMGNIFDRIIYGSVTDFLHFDFGLFHTGIVNLADISLTFGFFFLIYEFFITRRIY
jgi:signal peptidase II